MFRSLHLPLRVTLLTLIALLLFFSVGALSLYNFKRNSDAAIAIAEDLIAEVNDKVFLEMESLYDPVLALCAQVTELGNLADKPGLFSHEFTWFFVESLEANSDIYSIFIGYADDDFYQVISVAEDDKRLRDVILAPKRTRFALRRILTRPDGKRVEIWKFMDANRKTVGSRMVKVVNYRPTRRAWFEQASTTDRIVRTAPYPFASSRSLGLTVARRFDGEVPGVLGVDMTLSSLSGFLDRQHVGKSGVAMLFTGSGVLLGHPDKGYTSLVDSPGPYQNLSPNRMDSLGDPVLDGVYAAFLSAGAMAGPVRLTAGGVDYIGRITAAPGRFLTDGFVAVLAPVDDFTGDIRQTRDDSLMFSLVILAIALPLVYLISRRVSQSLFRLNLEAEKIRRLDLDEPVKACSRIKEIDDLAQAMGSMKGALQTFGQYVPRGLVEKIIAQDLSPTLGGNRRALTILFTDVADFTSISEKASSEELMVWISDYFQSMGRVVMDHNGTIDKFIGDAIMAFWNAPSCDPEHEKRACAAALEAAKVSNELNARWDEQGRPRFYTRFGLHSGECIVGNVGSSDRMDYTAMGDTVNMASRLEGLNKHFGTQILASGPVRDAAKDVFAFRPAGRVVPKGKTEPTDIYELTGYVRDMDARHLEAWAEAYGLYMKREFSLARDSFAALGRDRPEDGLAAHYIAMSQRHLASPPPEDWGGVETFSTK